MNRQWTLIFFAKKSTRDCQTRLVTNVMKAISSTQRRILTQFGGAFFGMHLSAILRGEVVSEGWNTHNLEYFQLPHGKTVISRLDGTLDSRGQCSAAVDPSFFAMQVMPDTWKKHIFHTGSSNHCKSITENGLRAGGTSSREGRHACSFSALNPRDETPVI